MVTKSEGPRALLEQLIATIVSDATACHLDGSLFEEIGPYVETDTTEAKSAEQLLAEAYRPERARLLDFGCGSAFHRGTIEAIGYKWRGIDFIGAVSPLVADTVRALEGQVDLYDGRIMPYPDGSFDVIWAMVVLHHVRHIDETFGELARVLDSGGKLIGQVSAMEQMQDFSTFNFTPFGLKTAAESAGLRINKIHPKHDVFSFLFRRLMITLGSDDDTELDPMLNPEGFFHTRLIELGRRLNLPTQSVNLLRLKFCMQYNFEIEKP